MQQFSMKVPKSIIWKRLKQSFIIPFAYWVKQKNRWAWSSMLEHLYYGQSCPCVYEPFQGQNMANIADHITGYGFELF